MTLPRTLLASAAVLALAACSQSPGGAGRTAASNTTGDASTRTAGAPSGLSLQAVNGAQFAGASGGAQPSGNEAGDDNEISGYDNVGGNATGSAVMCEQAT